MESIEYVVESRANLNRVRLRKTFGVGKFYTVVKDDCSKTCLLYTSDAADDFAVV